MTLRIAAALVFSLTACQGGMTVSSPSTPAGQSGSASDAGQPPSGSDAGNSATVVSLSISPAAPSVPHGAQEQLIATAHLSDGTTSDVSAQATWSISDASVAELSRSSDGLEWLHGVATGSATMSVTYGAQWASTAVTITAPAVTELVLTLTNVSIAAGTSLRLGAIGLYTDGTRRDVTAAASWATSNAAVVTSGGAGLFTAAGTGTASVSAALGGLTAATSVTVTSATLNSIVLSPADATIAAGTGQAYVATGIFSDYTSQDVTQLASWTSSDSSVAPMSGPVVTGAAPGGVTISAALSGVTGSTTLTVTSATLTAIEIAPVAPTIAAGTGCSFSANALFSDGSVQDLSSQVAWASSNADVATVDADGVATGLAAGASTISASFGGYSDSTTLTVTAAQLATITVADTTTPLPTGSDRQLTATGGFSDSSVQDLTAEVLWSTSDPSVATVTSAGVVHAVAAGPVRIYASLLGLTGSAPLTVSSATLTSIAIGPANPQVPVKFWTALTATGTFSDGSTARLANQVVWTSSNTSVASIGSTSGVATGLASGTTTITAHVGSVAGAATLTVMNTRLSSISLAPATLSLAAGATGTLVATGAFANGFTMDLTAQLKWSSSSRGVAISNNSQRGLVRAVSAGTATITASRGGKSGSAAVTIH